MKTPGKIAAAAMRSCLFLLVVVTVTTAADDRCALPPGLRDGLAKSYPGGRVVGLSDLTDSDRDLFRKDHGDACPGLVEVDFYGDKKPTWAVALLEQGPKRKAELVVAHNVDKAWEIRSLDSEEGDVPVVWRQDPGKYEDVHGNKTILATRPVAVFCGYQGWAILYAWTGKLVDKIWLSD